MFLSMFETGQKVFHFQFIFFETFFLFNFSVLFNNNNKQTSKKKKEQIKIKDRE